MDTRPIALAPLRHVPRQVRWLEQRLGRERALDPLSPHAGALYLLLGTGADAQGLRSSAAPSLGQRWSRTGPAFHQAPPALLPRGLSASQRPLSPG